MKKLKQTSLEPDILRQKAELLLEKKTIKNGLQLADADAKRLIHELEVHQIELEMQNEELRRTKEEAEIASQKYLELYDFAPSGYFTVSKDGKIIDLNLRGSQLLGKDHKYLKNSWLVFFISQDTRPIFDNFLKRIFSSKTKETCELTLSVHKHPPVYVYLTGMISGNGEKCLVNIIDISERRQAETALRESEERSRTIILQTAMDGFWLVDMKGKLLEVNETYCRMSGYSAQELLLMHIADLEAVESENETVAHIQKILDHGEDFFESRHRRKDGSFFDVEISVQYQTEKGGRFVVFVRDITSRKQAEQALIESEKRYRSLFEQGNDAIFLVDLSTGCYIDCNRMAETLTEYARYEIIGMKTGSFLPPPRKGELESNMKVILSGKALMSETEITTRGGKLIPVEFNSSMVMVNNKQCILSMLHDISKRRSAEVALKQSEERVRFKLQSILSPEGSIADLELNDIIDVPSIQQLLDNFYQLVKIPMAIIDLQGKVLVGVGWQDICTQFHRVHPLACRNCFESDVHLTKGITDGEFMLYKCKNNMWDMATPLIIGGEHKGNLYLGQFFFKHEPIDYAQFSKQAQQYGFDEQEYLDALRKVPRLGKHKIENAKSFFLNLSRSISQLSYGNIKLAKAIAQQKIIEDALRESEEFLNKAQEIAHLGSWTLDLIENRLTWSDEIYRIFGRKPREFSATYEGFIEAVHPEDRDAVNSAYSNSIKDGKDNYEIEHRIIRTHSGEIRHVYEKCEHIRDASGKIIRSVGMVHDITERMQSEKALMENERLLRESQAVGNIGSYSVDLINRNWKASTEVYKIFGIDKTHSNSVDSWIDSLHPEFRNELVNDLFNGEPGKEKFEHEYKIYRINDRQERWVSGLGKFEYDGRLNPVRLIGTIQDITERKLKEEALHKLNQILTAIGKSSQAMSQASNEADYLNQVCKIVIDDTDFAMVWIGFAEEDKAKSIRPVASAGFNDNYLETIKLSWGDSMYGRGPTGVAIRTGNMSVCNNVLTDPAFEPWREQALKRGYASSIVFPLKSGDKTFGAISIYSREPESFLVDEIKLLSELASDLEHGITTIRLRTAHQLAVDRLSNSHSELEVLVKERTRELEITNDLLVKEIVISKQHAHNLKLAEEKYRTVADFTYDWEYWMNVEGSYNYVSPSCERITGYKAEEFIQNPKLVYDIVYSEDLKVFQYHKQKEELSLKGIMNTIQERIHEVQFRIIRIDGSLRWIGQVWQAIYDKSGIFIGIRGSNRDITVRKETEQLLKTSNKKYKLLSQNITDGIFICKNGNFVYVNKAMCIIFGYPDCQMEGLKLTQLAIPEYRKSLENFLNLNGSLNQRRNFEVECIKKDQSIISVEFLFNYIATEKVIYGVAHDITDKKQIQKNIVKAIILTEEKERTYFSKELHDGLGPLLSTIKLYLEWSKEANNRQSREEIVSKAEEIIEDSIRTVKEISNKLNPHILINFGLCSAIKSFVDKLQDTTSIKIKFDCNTPKRLGSEIEAAIYRAVIECINNSLKYSEAKNITIILNDTDNQLQLRYLDDGIGFDIKETIAIKKGLGLFNLQNRIQTIGGKIKMLSKLGKGVDYRIVVNI